MSKKISRRKFIAQTGIGVGLAGVAGSCATEGKNGATLSDELPKQTLGRTGQLVSRIGFGGGSRYYQWVPDERGAEQLIEHAMKLGVNYFDTARGYGQVQESEVRFGKYLTPKYRDVIFLVSKTQSRTYDAVMQDIEATLKNLNTDHLDLYHMHAMNGMEDVEKLSASDGGFKAYRQLKGDGTVKNIGFSFHVDWDAGIKEAVDRFDPDVIMCALNAAKTPNSNAGVGNEEELLPLAKERNIGIVAMKVTGQNRLIGNVNGQDLLRYTLSLPVVTLANVGMDGFGTLESCVAVAKESPLSDEQRQAIHVALDYKPGTHRLAYFQPDYIDGEQIS